MQQTNPETLDLFVAQDDFVDISEQITIVRAQGANASESFFGRKFQADKPESFARFLEAHARRHQAGIFFGQGAQCDELLVGVSLLDEDFVVTDREVTVQQRDAKSFIGLFLHKAASDFVEAYIIVFRQAACARKVNVR
ncbi:hypothetical protein [Bradyrhizobium sp. LTSP857]|uniref:hypothetical protein n=1 Tax=Bradyrhizobium sp. LTSP857 TaxID=1619231 RepID=UPI0005D2031D|nr:hypothetical protein [Bradyrhizobium sp. LTSP857]KJC45307.1 hypothetical protein UP06_14875 [Bradyrhizobium sp. LTSP857]